MNKIARFKMIALFMYIAIFSVFFGACGENKEKEAVGKATSQSSSSSTPINPITYVSRDVLGNRLLQQEKLLEDDPNNKPYKVSYAQTLYALGNFEFAEKIIEPLIKEKKPLPAVIELSARINYVNGNYEESEKLYKKILNNKDKELATRTKEALLNVYYQTNQFKKAKEIEYKEDEKPAIQDLMESFGDSMPYQTNWNGNDKVTIPFVATDPAPVIPIEVNGVKMNAVIDTSADGLLLDKEKAAELEVNSVADFLGRSEGGSSGPVSYGKVNSLKMGEIEMSNIPTTISSLANAREEVFTDTPDVHAIVGTSILKQFIPTLNYKTGEITFIPRGEAGRNQLEQMIPRDKILDQVPFSLSGTHYLHAKGSVNRNNYLNMFINSGLVTKGGNGPILSGSLMKILKTPIPKLGESHLSGIDGEKFQVGSLSISSYGVGRLLSQSSIGQYYSGEALENLGQANGFISDAMIGHNFLKQQNWTIDFDQMSMIFSKQDD
ncbi:retroviral-like aspartic protease family protein [Enterococcus avium]